MSTERSVETRRTDPESAGRRRWSVAHPATAPALAALAVGLFALFVCHPWWRRLSGGSFLELAASIQDDSYYYLVPAFQLKERGFFTFDGAEPTYGFQPAYELVLSALALGYSDFESFFRGALKLNLALHVVTAALVAWLVARCVRGSSGFVRLVQYAIAVATGAFALTRASVLLSVTTGKENALASFLLVLGLCVAAWPGETERRRRAMAVVGGGLVSLLMLCRVLPTTVVLSVALLALLYGRTRDVKGLLAGVIPPVAAWGAYAWLAFGHIVPTSVRVKAAAAPGGGSGVLVLLENGVEYAHEAVRFAMGGKAFWLPQVDADVAFSSLRQGRVWMTVALVVVALRVPYAVRTFVGRPDFRVLSRDVLEAALVAITAAVLLVYPLQGMLIAHRRSGELFYYVWYLFDLPPLLAVVVGTASSSAVRTFADAVSSRERQTIANTFVPFAAASTILLLLISAMPREVRALRRMAPYAIFDRHLERWPHTMIRAATWARDHLPIGPTRRVGCWSCGALALGLGGNLLSLDGLANDEGARHRLEHPEDILSYVIAARPRYVIDIHFPPLFADPRLSARVVHREPFEGEGDYEIVELTYPDEDAPHPR